MPFCLQCHATPVPERAGLSRQDGVGCESCHGPARRWISIHYLSDWSGKSVQEKRRFGMLPTKDLVSRAEACVDCHVGSVHAQVDHDLIAAGIHG